MDKSIEQFFQDYSAAFEAADGPRIAEFYHVPCMTIRLDGSFHEFCTADDIAKFFGQVARGYIGEGMRSGRPQSLETNALAYPSSANWTSNARNSMIRWRRQLPHRQQ